MGHAGLGPAGPLSRGHPLAAWHDQMRRNAEGTAFTVQAVLPYMRAAGWGRVVLVSSGAVDGAPGLEQHAAAKAALHGLARSAGPAGILTNIVMLGLIPNAQAPPPGVHPSWSYRARILLLRALCSTSARPSTSMTGGT
ncbi:MAG TPA: SDR family NAD(P)-dependent oxidoreductase [Streptosporangiaceae bacterium]|nr:SDR family NAD(P)-dependent oxidoreductase [Streptosporangiaceae bacterium]